MTTPQRKANCLFCSQRADSKEHIIALGILDRVARRQMKVNVGKVSAGGHEIWATINPQKFTTRQVCKKCNNEWMSRLDAWFIENLGILVEPNWPYWANTSLIFQRLKNNGGKLVQWMTKTAIMLERATPRPKDWKLPEAIFDMAKLGNFTDDFYVMIAHIHTAGFHACVMPGFPTLNGGVLHNYQVREDRSSLSFIVQFNHLAIRLYRCPGGMPDICYADEPQEPFAMPFWVYPQTMIYQKEVSQHSFQTLLDFNQSVHIKI